MSALPISGFVLIALSIVCSVHADEQYIVEHRDPITIDSQLSLSELIDLTWQNYPESALLPALKQETEALRQRGDSWVAGALTATFSYRNGWVRDAVGTGAPEIAGAIELPLWNWGQRAAGQRLAQMAEQANTLRSKVFKLRVAGLVRNALWDIALTNNRYEIAKYVYQVSEQLVKTVRRRVELGDLPRTDLLLAQTEQLRKRSELVQAEAEQMHARKRFATLTQMTRVPADFTEPQSEKKITPQHPALSALNAFIERKRAELDWVKASGSGQPTLAIGGNSQRTTPDYSAETLTLDVSVPFGGSAHKAPEIARANLELSNAISQRAHLYRDLEQSFHEALHILEIDRSELEIARQRRQIAETHLEMTQLSFSSGEINLLDLLKIQSRAFAAIRDAKESELKLQRDIAFYNQVVGQLP